MNQLVWKGKPFKLLSFGTVLEKAGRNFSGKITIFHRGGGAKRLYRRIDYHRREAILQGYVERVEYDPNRTARIALINWSAFSVDPMSPGFARFKQQLNGYKMTNQVVQKDLQKSSEPLLRSTDFLKRQAFSYILAWEDIQPGDEIWNFENQSNPVIQDSIGRSKKSFAPISSSKHTSDPSISTLDEKNFVGELNLKTSSMRQLFQKKGVSMPLYLVPLGSMIHNIELQPGKGGQIVRAAGTCAQLVKKDDRNAVDSTISSKSSSYILRMPSGQQQQLDSRCRVTIGTVSNSNHNSRRLKKAGQKRWLGWRPVVRGVAMNPIDHPHCGGEGRTKGGRPSVSPWGKPSKSGFGSLKKNRRK